MSKPFLEIIENGQLTVDLEAEEYQKYIDIQVKNKIMISKGIEDGGFEVVD